MCVCVCEQGEPRYEYVPTPGKSEPILRFAELNPMSDQVEYFSVQYFENRSSTLYITNILTPMCLTNI